jgi:hypothetical protein
MVVLLRLRVSKIPRNSSRVVAFFSLLHHTSTRLSFHLSTALFARFLHIRKYVSLIEAICIAYELPDNSAITALCSIIVASVDIFSKFSSLRRRINHLDSVHSAGGF